MDSKLGFMGMIMSVIAIILIITFMTGMINPPFEQSHNIYFYSDDLTIDYYREYSNIDGFNTTYIDINDDRILTKDLQGLEDFVNTYIHTDPTINVAMGYVDGERILEFSMTDPLEVGTIYMFEYSVIIP